ncbi:MAG: hypothetical protein WC319_14870 [Candidatus Paceibacterota bacterium]
MNNKKYFFKKNINVSACYFSCAVQKMDTLVEELVVHLGFHPQYGFQNNPTGYSLFCTSIIAIRYLLIKLLVYDKPKGIYTKIHNT